MVPLTSTALLSPRVSAVLSFIFSTRRCFTFFIPGEEEERGEGVREEGGVRERGREWREGREG